MRTIIFRGKCIQSNDLVSGDLIHGVGSKKGEMFILPNRVNLAYVKHCDPIDGVKVIPETIGQFTGLSDKNGVEIYEGDIVKVDIFTKNYCIVFGESKKWGASFQYKADFSIYYLTESFAKDCSVIGNIFDTPELL